MTKETRNKVTFGGIVAGSVILSAILAFSGFATSRDLENERTARIEADTALRRERHIDIQRLESSLKRDMDDLKRIGCVGLSRAQKDVVDCP